MHKKNPTEYIRNVILDALMYEMYLAPEPTDPYWAARALEAIGDAGLWDEGELQEAKRWFFRARAEKIARALEPAHVSGR